MKKSTRKPGSTKVRRTPSAPKDLTARKTGSVKGKAAKKFYIFVSSSGPAVLI